MHRPCLALIPAALLFLACGSEGDSMGVPWATGGSGGAAAQSGGTEATVSSDPGNLVIDNFESGARHWYPFTDQTNGGDSVITTPPDGVTGIEMVGEGYASPTSMQIDATFDQGSLTYPPYIGVSVNVADVDWTTFAGVTYVYHGPAHTIRLETTDVKDYDFHGKKLPAASQWTAVEIRLDEVAQEGWGEPVAFDPAHVQNLSFHEQGTTGDSSSLVIDDLTAVATVAPPSTTPDMSILPPAPPAKQEISGEVTNPLQAKALQYLNRGINLSDWLEAGPFEGFDYDDTYVANLAAAGFQALRLPIDLGRYVTQEDPLVLDEDLWLILDSFDTWTSTSGLSLTIDWHEYDGSFDADDPQYVAFMAAVWGAVAEHFATSPREDLFYELINEPALSAGSNLDPSETGPSRESLTAFAESMIAAIRAHDTTHTLLFGDYNWSGIDDLSSRDTLLSDDNVVYVFHNYDPFLFTHQGASWTDLASAHDIPWPYSEDRWSEFYRDFGLSASTPSWLLQQLRSYNTLGNQNYLYNRMGKAKQWSITHDVPVVCNEFGPYEAKAQHEDVIRYYTDLIEVFEELDVPWQVWWNVLDQDTGQVPADLAAAMHLN